MESSITLVITQLLGTVCLILIIKHFAYKNYKIYMEKRTNFINDSITNARDNDELAKKTLENIKLEEKEIKNHKQVIYSEAKKQAIIEKEEIVQESKNQARNILEKAHEEILNNQRIVEQELASQLMENVSLVASKFIAEAMTKEDEMKMINQAIAKVSNEK